MTEEEARDLVKAMLPIARAALAAGKAAQGGGAFGFEVPLAFAHCLVATCRSRGMPPPEEVLKWARGLEKDVDVLHGRRQRDPEG